MRRAILSISAVMLLLYGATPSQAGWLLHHGYYHYHHAGMPATAMMAQPLMFQLPGGVGVNVDLQQLLGQFLGQLDQQTKNQNQNQNQKAATLQASPDVVKKVTDIQAAVNSGVDDLNTLTKRMNDKLKSNPNLVPAALTKDGQFTPIAKTAGSSIAGKTSGLTSKSEGP